MTKRTGRRLYWTEDDRDFLVEEINSARQDIDDLIARVTVLERG